MARRGFLPCAALVLSIATLCCGVIAAAVAADTAPAEQIAVPAEPADYRMTDYRAQTPSTLAGVRVVDTADAFRLWSTRTAVFVDVMPQAPKPANLPSGTYWHEAPRLSVPGATWLPDTGYGKLSETTARYLSRALEQLTGGDRTRAVLFFCRASCWMSWNAAKRAHTELGYLDVLWFREGTDGWSAAGHKLVAVERAPS